MAEDRIIRIENKIDRIGDRLLNIDVTLTAQHESLKHHILRTNLLEDQLKPIKNNHEVFKGIIKIVVFLGILAGIIECLLLYLRF